jgi:hypothetical protein
MCVQSVQSSMIKQSPAQAADVRQFDKSSGNLSRMAQFMEVMKHYAVVRGVWKPHGATIYWNGETCTKLWDGVWDDISPHLLTKTQYKHGRPPSYHKSRVASLSWRTCHNKFLGTVQMVCLTSWE